MKELPKLNREDTDDLKEVPSSDEDPSLEMSLSVRFLQFLRPFGSFTRYSPILEVLSVFQPVTFSVISLKKK